jgi:hypothetical protein
VIVLLVLLVFAVGLAVGTWMGLDAGTKRTKDALKLTRYNDAIALADDLVKTPDALDLRPRAQQLLDAHRAANPHRE